MPVSEDDRSARHERRAGGADHALRPRVREGDGDLLEDAGYFVGYTRQA